MSEGYEQTNWSGAFRLLQAGEEENRTTQAATDWPAAAFFDSETTNQIVGTPDTFQDFSQKDFNGGDGGVAYDTFHGASPTSDFSNVFPDEGPPTHQYNTRLASSYTSDRSLGHSSSPLESEASPLRQLSSEHASPIEVVESDDVRLDRLIATDPKTALKLMKFREIYAKSLLEFAQVLDRLQPQDEHTFMSTLSSCRPEYLLEGVNYIGQGTDDPATYMARTTLIEMDKWCLSRDQVDANLQRQKFYELYQNLKRTNNKELRIKIVSGEIPIAQLVDMDGKDLAPESLKKKRETEAEKYFKQQVILKDDPTASIIIKTHKGIETIAPTMTDKKDDKAASDRVATPVDSSDTEEEDSSVPWINELGPETEGEFLMETQQAAEPAEASVKFSPTLSPAVFSQLIPRPWTQLLSFDADLLTAAKMKELPSDPSDALFPNQADRLLNRLHWLESQQEMRRLSKKETPASIEITSLISRLKGSLIEHAERLETGGWVRTTPSMRLPPPRTFR